MKVEIYTKRLKQHFKGELFKTTYMNHGKNRWIVLCDTYGGGGMKVSLLNVCDFKESSQKKLKDRLKRFAVRGGYQIKFSKS